MLICLWGGLALVGHGPSGAFPIDLSVVVTDSEDAGGLSTAAIAGIVAGAVGAIMITGGVIFKSVQHLKRNKVLPISDPFGFDQRFQYQQQQLLSTPAVELDVVL